MFDVLIGVNLLREGLDLPQVSLVAILDADKEGFLRSHRSLTQTVGRAARHLNGKAIMYADTITESMRLTIEETARRREKQLKYNADNNITPQAVTSRTSVSPLPTKGEVEVSARPITPRGYVEKSVETSTSAIAADPVVQYMSNQDIEKSIKNARRRMEEAAKRLDFIEAAQWRDEMLQFEELLK
jgi:excinuclease ABC subunit B